MDSLSPACTELKEEYDRCFNSWYSGKFLKGKGADNECQALFERYRACVQTAMKERGLDPAEVKLDQTSFDFDGNNKSGKPSSAASADSKGAPAADGKA